MKKILIYAGIFGVALLLVGFQKGFFNFSKMVEPGVTQAPQSSNVSFIDENDVTSIASDNSIEGSVTAINKRPVSNTSFEEFLAFETESKGLRAELELSLIHI